ncbi:MAG TPA: LysM domain-containing protein [Gaiellaceae bacterium]|nr:LysM domain-containing protein [Gaiellaceae bacterium]
MGRVGLVDRRGLARVAAPLAFLAAVTVAVLLVRAGLDEASTRAVRERPGSTTPVGTTTPQQPARRYYRVRAGDTLAAIAPRFGLTEAELVALNPGIEPTALRIGQRIRVR